LRDVVDADVNGPLHRVLEYLSHRAARCRVRRIEDVRIAEITGQECAAFIAHVFTIASACRLIWRATARRDPHGSALHDPGGDRMRFS